jgi:UDP-N-acetylglucosamine 2-epimerase (non-hydrolysing)
VTVLLLATPDGVRPRDALVGDLPGGVAEDLAPAARESGAARTAAAMLAAEPLLDRHRPEAVVLCGDGAEVAAAALVAVKLGIPQARVGAGAREGDRRKPAEIDRGIADRLCDLLLCEDDAALTNLRREGLAEWAVVVGDVGADPAAAVAAIQEWLAGRGASG